MPLVSVYMGTWNQERFIAEAIESVLGQDFEDLELIIVDGASTDETRKIIDRYAQQDPRIRVIFQERNMGISGACNDGIEAAKGKFVANIDSDDVWVPDKLTKQLAVLERDEDLIVWSEGGLLLIAVLVYTFWPENVSASQLEKTRVDYLLERKEQLYENLRDLNFEFKAGKYPEEDFQAQRAQLENETARLMAEIEILQQA